MFIQYSLKFQQTIIEFSVDIHWNILSMNFGLIFNEYQLTYFHLLFND